MALGSYSRRDNHPAEDASILPKPPEKSCVRCVPFLSPSWLEIDQAKNLTVTDFGEGDWTIPTGLVPVDEGFGYYVGTFSEYDMGAIRARADRRDPHGLARG